MRLVAVLLLVACAAIGAQGASPPPVKKYRNGEKVPVVSTKVGPLGNPTEVYPFFHLPYCGGPGHEGTGDFVDALGGLRRQETGFDIKFGRGAERQEVCTATVGTSEVDAFRNAVQEDFFFELLVDELPAWSFVGRHEDVDLIAEQVSSSVGHDFLFTHFIFSVLANKEYVLEVNVTVDPTSAVLLVPPAEVNALLNPTSSLRGHESRGIIPFNPEAPSSLSSPVDLSPYLPQLSTDGASLRVPFSYSVVWRTTDAPLATRHATYHTSPFLPLGLEVHWLSIINAGIIAVLLLVVLLILFYGVVKQDLGTPDLLEDDTDAAERRGWKVLWGDVFRAPEWATILSAAVGAGTQLAVAATLLFLSILGGLFHVTRRGAVLAFFIGFYCIAAFAGGYVSARLYRQFRGLASAGWIANLMAALLAFPLPLLTVFAWVNTTAISSASSAALPAHTVTTIVLLFLFVNAPLMMLGGRFGRQSVPYDPPKQPLARKRRIPPVAWYKSAPFTVLATGLIPFTCIMVELHYIFTAIWGHQMYTLYGVLSIAFVLLVAVAGFATIAQTYVHLSSEDYLWHWRAFLAGGSVAVFIFLYSLYFLAGFTSMSGFLQISFFLGYTLVISYAAFLMMGAIGFLTTYSFLDYIYRRVRID